MPTTSLILSFLFLLLVGNWHVLNVGEESIMLLGDENSVDEIKHVQQYANHAENLNYKHGDVGKVDREKNRLK